jgi:hypothetical protein
MKLYRVTYSTLFGAEDNASPEQLRSLGKAFILDEMKLNKNSQELVEITHIKSMEELRPNEHNINLWGFYNDTYPYDVLNDPKNDPEYDEYVRLSNKFTEKFKRFGGAK